MGGGDQTLPTVWKFGAQRVIFMEGVTHSTLLDRSDTVGLRTTSLQVEVTGQV